MAPPGLAARSAALNARYGLTKKAKVTPIKVVVKRPVAKKIPVKVAAAAKPLTLAEQAAQIAALSIDPSTQDLSAQIKQAETDRVAGATATAKIAEALGHLSQGDSAAARDAYAQAADSIAGYAKGFTGNLRTGQEAAAAADNARIAGLGSPGGPVVEHAGENADVSYLLGGQMPAESLAKRAASALVATQDRRYAGGARLADTGLANDYKTEQSIAGLRTQLLKVEAQRPGLIAQALQQLSAQQNQKRATDVQVGTLQLQQAKTLGEQAVALTNLTGTIHIVKGKKVVDTGRLASGSDAAQIAQTAATAQAGITTRANTAAADRAARITTAKIAADAKLAANAATNETRLVTAQIARQKAAGKPATAGQKATILKNAGTQGNSLVVTTRDRIWALIPNAAPQSKDEKPEDYQKRHETALKVYKARLKEHRAEIVGRVAALIGDQLKLIGYTPAQIQAQANAIVSAQIPG